MRPTLSLAAAAVAALALLLPPAAGWRTRGALDALPPACGADLDALLATHYPNIKLPSGATAPSECGATVRDALSVNVTSKCPDDATLVACFNVSEREMKRGSDVGRQGSGGRERESWGVQRLIMHTHALPTSPLQTARDAWTGFIAKCELFAGVPAGGAPPSSTRRLTAADAEAEGEGEGEGAGASLDGQGCFPAFGSAADFGAWLDGTFTEPVRHGKASPVAIASVVVFAGALLSMAAL